jgi:hypothetical protein
VTARETHSSRTKLEAAVCEEMLRQGLPHGHRTLHFRVRGANGTAAKYSPTLVAHRGPILFLVEPLPSAAPRTIERLGRFLEQHSPEIVLVLVAPDAALRKIPPDAYDEIYAATDIAQMTRRIREQSPSGIVRLFRKPMLDPGGTRDTRGTFETGGEDG